MIGPVFGYQQQIHTAEAGTNVEEGNRIIATSGLPLITADTLADAAAKAVAARPKLAA